MKERGIKGNSIQTGTADSKYCIKSMFYFLHVPPNDLNLLSTAFEDKVYLDNTLPMDCMCFFCAEFAAHQLDDLHFTGLANSDGCGLLFNCEFAHQP